MNDCISNLVRYSQFPLSRCMRSRYGPGASTVPGRSKTAMVAGSWPGGTWPTRDWNIVNAASQPPARSVRSISS